MAQRKPGTLMMVMVVSAMVMAVTLPSPASAAAMGRARRQRRQVSLGNIMGLLMRPTDPTAPALDTVSKLPFCSRFTFQRVCFPCRVFLLLKID